MIVIREAVAGESRTISSFQVMMARETENLGLDPEVVERGVLGVFEDPSRGCYFVAETGGSIAGSLLVTYEWSDWRNSTILWLQSVYILPQYRNRGIFRKLYEFIKQLVNETPGYGGIRLYVDKGNEKAIRVYRQIGMNDNHYKLFEWMPE